MSMPPYAPPPSGAAVGALVPEPAVDLAALVHHLAAAIPPRSQAHPNYPETGRAFINWNPGQGILSVDTGAVLARLRTSPPTREALRKFIVDAPVPQGPSRAHLGGVIKPGTEGPLREATQALVVAIDEQIALAESSGFDPTILSTNPSTAVLDTLGARVKRDPHRMLQGPTRVHRTRIDGAGSSQAQRQDEVARIVDAIEEVDGTRATHVEHFCASVEPRLIAAGHNQRQASAAVAYHRQQAEASGTQLSRFFDFLENEALSRVRAQVGCHIMGALAAEAEERLQAGTRGDWALLAAYARRATGLLASLGAPDAPALGLNLAAVYGQSASFSLRDQIINAGFVGCLPVWPQSRTQLFEELSRPSAQASGPTLARELTYHFRVNGVVPETGNPSYVSRLERIENGLSAAAPTVAEPRRNRYLTELVFLCAVIPESEATSAEPADALDSAEQLVRRLEQGGLSDIEVALHGLAARASVVERIADALIALLRSKGAVLPRSHLGQRWDYYVNVLPTILNLQRLGDRLEGPLNCGAPRTQEQIDFLRNTWITRDRSLPGAVLTVRVRVRLLEHSLSTVGAPEVLATRRCLPDTLFQVAWRSTTLSGKADAPDSAWLVAPRVELLYNTLWAFWPEKRAKDEQELCVLAASRSALAILAHLTLLRLVQRSEARTGQRAALSVLRLQEQGRGADPLSGDEGVYAAAQAVEIALTRDADLRMQGITFGSEAPNEYKERGAFAALFAGFPLQISQSQSSEAIKPEERPAIGVVTHASRPCNEHPDQPDARGSNLVLARTYMATPIDSPLVGYELRALDSRAELSDPSVALPATVAEEVERLYLRGCRHVILVGHCFGERRVGSEAAHPRLRDQGEILAQLAESHPDLVDCQGDFTG